MTDPGFVIFSSQNNPEKKAGVDWLRLHRGCPPY
jgi:hypothetical protein